LNDIKIIFDDYQVGKIQTPDIFVHSLNSIFNLVEYYRNNELGMNDNNKKLLVKEYRGFNLWHSSGKRYLLLEFEEFKNIMNLAFNKSVNLSLSNKKNLFTIWWRLSSENEYKFIKYYGKEYCNPFNSFKYDVNKFCNLIHRDYLNVNIYKKKNLKDIPFCYRDIIYELHGLWLREKIQTTFELVVSFIHNKFKEEPTKIYGRIYTPYVPEQQQSQQQQEQSQEMDISN